MEASGALGKAHVVNKELDVLESQLEALQQAGSADAFCSYLYGLILMDRYESTTQKSTGFPKAPSWFHTRIIRLQGP